MVRLYVELDDKTFEAIIDAARRQGLDVRRLEESAEMVVGTGETVARQSEDFNSWPQFFQWLESLKLDVKHRLGSRDDLYVR